MADDNQIGSDTLSLAANGHLAFTLGANTYASTAAISGTIEFDMPAGRIPAAHTFTTLPGAGEIDSGYSASYGAGVAGEYSLQCA